MELTVREIRPQTGRWRGTIIQPGDRIDLDAGLPYVNLAGSGEWSYTLPDNPRCYFCERPLRDRDEVEIYVRKKGYLSTITHSGCWIDECGDLHRYDEDKDYY